MPYLELTINVPYYELKCNELTSLIWIVIKGLLLMQSLLSYDDDAFTRDRPYDLDKVMIVNKDSKSFK